MTQHTKGTEGPHQDLVLELFNGLTATTNRIMDGAKKLDDQAKMNVQAHALAYHIATFMLTNQMSDDDIDVLMQGAKIRLRQLEYDEPGEITVN